jgi:hypothetical protein
MGLEHQVQSVQGSILELETLSESFDYVLAEAILTMQSPIGKARILADIHNRLKVGGKFLSHELLARDHLEILHQDLTQVTRVNATPLLEKDWISTFDEAGLTVKQHQVGAMKLLNPAQLLRDEGVIHTIQIAWNILTRPVIRDRILAMRRVFTQHQQGLSHITLCAIRAL